MSYCIPYPIAQPDDDNSVRKCHNDGSHNLAPASVGSQISISVRVGEKADILDGVQRHNIAFMICALLIEPTYPVWVMVTMAQYVAIGMLSNCSSVFFFVMTNSWTNILQSYTLGIRLHRLRRNG